MTEPPVMPQGNRRPNVLLPWLVAVACAVLAVVMAALWIAVPFPRGAIMEPPSVSTVRDGNGAVVSVTDAGSAFVKLFMSSDYRDFDGWADRVKEQCTGQLADEFAKVLDRLREEVTTKKATAIAEVPAVGISSAKADDVNGGPAVELLVFVNVSVHNVNSEAASDRQYRIKLAMTVVDGQWKAAKLEYVS